MNDRPRKTRIPPEHQRAMLLMLVSGAAFLAALVIIAVVLHFVR